MIAIVHGDDTFNQAVGDDNHVRSRSNRWTQEVSRIRLGHRVGSLADDGTTIASARILLLIVRGSLGRTNCNSHLKDPGRPRLPLTDL